MKLLTIAASALYITKQAKASLVSCEVYCSYCEGGPTDPNPNLDCSKVATCACDDVDFCNSKLEQGNWMNKPISDNDHTVLLLDETSSIWYQFEGMRQGQDYTADYVCGMDYDDNTPSAGKWSEASFYKSAGDRAPKDICTKEGKRLLDINNAEKSKDQTRLAKNIRHHIEELWRSHFLDTNAQVDPYLPNWKPYRDIESEYLKGNNSDRRFSYIKFNTKLDIDHYKNKKAIPGSVLDECNYQPGGLTSMLDSVGCVLTNYEHEKNVELWIMSDGQENSSVWFKNKIKSMIENAKSSGKNWKIYFIGLAETKTEEYEIREQAYDELGIDKEKILIFLKNDSGLLFSKYNENGELKSYAEKKWFKDTLTDIKEKKDRFVYRGSDLERERKNGANY